MTRRARSASTARSTGRGPVERGSTALSTLLAGMLTAAVALVVAFAAADVGSAAARARTAADGAALAAVATSPLAGGDGDHRAAAARVAAANGGEVTDADLDGWPLRVRVRVAVPTRAPAVRAVAGRVEAEAVAAVRPPAEAPDLAALGLVPWPAAGSGLAGPLPLLAADARAVLANPRITLTPGARADLAAGIVDSRVVAVLATIAQRHTVGVSVFRTGHSRYVAGTRRESNHYHGRAVDIAVVDGRPVRAGHPGARAITVWLAGLQGPLRPSEVGSPYADLAGRSPGHFTDAAHDDHLHLGWRGG